MSASKNFHLDDGWTISGRPQSTLARDFSAALDDLFKLNGVGALEESVEQKKETLQSQKHQIEDLDAKLRETDEKLRSLEAKCQRHVQMSINRRRQPVSSVFPADNDADYTSGDSDTHRQSSQPHDVRSR